MTLSAITPTHSSSPWAALALIVAAQFMVILDVAIVNVALPSIELDLGFSQSSLEWVVTAYAIVFGGFLLLGGRLADLVGRRRTFMAGIGLFTLASVLCGLSWSAGSLVAFRGLQGLGGALLAPAGLSLLMTTFAEGRERNLALGIWGAASGSGAAVGVLLGGVLTSYLSWPWIFFINAPVGVALLALTPRILRSRDVRGGLRHFDLAGALSATGAVMVLVYGLTVATDDGFGARRCAGAVRHGRGTRGGVRRDRAAGRAAAPAAADVPHPHVRGRKRDHDDRRVDRLLGVLPADAVHAGRPPLLGRRDGPGVRGHGGDDRGGLERGAGTRHAVRRPARADGGARAPHRLPRAHRPAARPGPVRRRPARPVRAQRDRPLAVLHPDDDRRPPGRDAGGRGRRLGPAQHEPSGGRRGRASRW